MAFAASWTGSEIFPVRLGEVVKGERFGWA